ncbi:MAG: hypothetical protein QGI51_00395 [Dehalococcoidales bacterium]|jgi:hypothetical protein|nr:menaquinol-cytochrome C reductase [Dehalococcoidales bacterium]MDP6631949.1 hypothetical protein [Dehalococcoidales bacterium]|tara:strand:+ start:306 stop:1055 length:750 start_codon:yes stop_codon:yes gene_type:complete
MSKDPGELFPKDSKKSYGLMELVKGTSPMVDKGPEDTVTSWPHLLILEVLASLGTMVLLLFMSVAWNAPLREFANPDVTENPSKAAWYFLNLQDLLLHMNPALAGVIIPTIVIVILMAIPYIDRSKADISIWFASQKGKAIATFAAVYTTIWLVALVLFDEYIQVKSFISEPEIIPAWIIPIIVISGLTGLLIMIIRRRWNPTKREMMVGLFSAFVTTYVVLLIVTLFFRGLGLHLVWPWNLPPGALPF